MSKKKQFTRYLLLLLAVISCGFRCFSQSTAAKPPSDYVSLRFIHDGEADESLQKSKSLQSVLTSFEAKYQVFISYDLEVVANKTVDARKFEEAQNKQDLEEALTLFLKPHNLDYKRVKESYYVIFPKVVDSTNEVKKINNVKPKNSNYYPLAATSSEKITHNLMGPVR